MDTEEVMLVSCILRFRDRVMGPIFVMETPDTVDVEVCEVADP